MLFRHNRCRYVWLTRKSILKHNNCAITVAPWLSFYQHRYDGPIEFAVHVPVFNWAFNFIEEVPK